MSDAALSQFESVIWANVPYLASADSRARRCAIECVRAAANDYADLRRTETLPGDVRTAARLALLAADAAPGAPSPELAAFRRYVLDQAAEAHYYASLARSRKARAGDGNVTPIRRSA